MRHSKLLLVLVFLLAFCAHNTHAGPGDTIVVKTFTFDQRAPYEGKFLFPSTAKRFEKILMYYKLKCNPAQSPACGEWDYLTYTNVYQHTGRLDSTLKSQPSFTVNGAARDTLLATRTPAWIYGGRFEKSITHTATISLKEASIGSGTLTIDPRHGIGAKDRRYQFLWRADELVAAGLAAGPITGLRLSVASGASHFQNLTLRIRGTSQSDLSAVAPVLDGFTTVYQQGTRMQAGIVPLQFLVPYQWDGTQNLLIDVSYTYSDDSPILLSGDATGFTAGLDTDPADAAVDFAAVSQAVAPVDRFETVSDAITVALWCYGDAAALPANTSIFEANDAQGKRVINAHLPWGNGRIYWDAGAGTYDRIEKDALPENYKGRWNHWAFTKDARTGDMRIYLNGELWHSGTGKTKPMNGIREFRIGSNGAGAGSYYDGLIDDVCVWNVVLDQASIQGLMRGTPGPSHPFASSLVAQYTFDEGHGALTANNAIPGSAARLVGGAFWADYRGDRQKNFIPVPARPSVVFEQGVYTSRIDSVFVPDSAAVHPMMVVRYGDSTHATTPTDTLLVWAPFWRYTFDASGKIIDSSYVAADDTFIRQNWPYYGPPFEVVNRFEIGRFITPYGINLDLGEGWTWIYDVTDFAPLLTDSVHISAGNWQELLELNFVMIEGIPPRDVVRVQNVWNGDWSLKSFAERVPPKRVGLDPRATSHRLKVTTTGHQFSNATNCAEFCPKVHSLDINGATRYSWQIIQECADNPLYPQGGTWIYDRAGWCPGMPAATQNLELTPYVSGDSALIDYNSEYDEFGNYVVETQLISYGPANFTRDAALLDIITPSTYEMHRRFNPACSRPRIRIRNNGSETLTSLDIAYGPVGGNTNTWRWTGSLDFLSETDVFLPSFDWGTPSGENRFRVSLSNPNGGADEYQVNNVMTSSFVPVPVHPKPIYVYFKTNLAASENWYEVLDAEGNQVHVKSGFANNTINRDTLKLPNGCYEFILHDTGNDGISFWANNDGSGNINFRMVGGSLWASLGADFGKETRYSFRLEIPTAVDDVPVTVDAFEVYPNPAASGITVSFEHQASAHITISLTDLLGRRILTHDAGNMNTGTHELLLSTQGVAPGTYVLDVARDGKPFRQATVRVLR